MSVPLFAVAMGVINVIAIPPMIYWHVVMERNRKRFEQAYAIFLSMEQP